MLVNESAGCRVTAQGQTRLGGVSDPEPTLRSVFENDRMRRCPGAGEPDRLRGPNAFTRRDHSA
jgi:hypothetical protein